MDWPYIIAGVIIGLFGWMVYWAGTLAIGAIVGGGALGMLGYILGGLIPAPWGSTLGVGVGVVLGTIGGVFFIRAMMLYFFFAMGASLGGSIAWKLAHGGALSFLPGASEGIGLTVTVIVGMLLCGFLILALRRFIIAVVTSVVGATLLSLGLPPTWQSAGWLIALVVFMVVQAGLVHRFVDRDSFDRRAMHPRYREQDN